MDINVPKTHAKWFVLSENDKKAMLCRIVQAGVGCGGLSCSECPLMRVFNTKVLEKNMVEYHNRKVLS